MKRKNFPGRKLQRQMVAQGIDLNSLDSIKKIESAKQIRTKIRREK